MSQAVLVSWLAVRRARHNRAGGGGFELANRKPSVAIAWILAIFFIPVLGIAFFLLTGFGKLPRKRRERQREVCEATLARTDGWIRSVIARNGRAGWRRW